MKKFNVPEAVRFGVEEIGCMSVGYVIGNIINKAMPGNVGKIGKIATYIGTSIICGILGNKVADYMEESFDETEKLVNEVREIAEAYKPEKEVATA